MSWRLIFFINLPVGAAAVALLARTQHVDIGDGNAMSNWTANELDRIGAADELQIAPLGADGTPGRYTTIWVVRVGDDVYVRSYRGRGGRWFRRALHSRQGRIRAGGLEREVTFAEPADADRAAIDEAYRVKYARYSRSYVDPMVAPDATVATLRLTPR